MREAVTFGGGFFSKSTEPYLEGLQYQKLAPINIPMVAEGKVQGYVIAVLVFTADAKLIIRLGREKAGEDVMGPIVGSIPGLNQFV